MEVPTEYNNYNREYVLKLKTNMYSLSNASLIQYEYCMKELITCGFTTSKINSCLF